MMQQNLDFIIQLGQVLRPIKLRNPTLELTIKVAWITVQEPYLDLIIGVLRSYIIGTALREATKFKKANHLIRRAMCRLSAWPS